MKKAILLFTLLAVCVGMVLPAYAAGSAFTPSVSYKGEPDLVGTEVTIPGESAPVEIIGAVRDTAKTPSTPDESKDPAEREDFVCYVHPDCIVVTPVSKAKTSDKIPAEAAAELLDVYEKLTNGSMKLPYDQVPGIKAENMVIIELLDVSWLCGIPTGDDHPTILEPEGIVFDLTFDLGVAVDAKLVVMSYHDGQWAPIAAVENNRDGTVTCTFEHLCPVAIAIENAEPEEGPSQTGDTTPIGLWIAVMVIALTALVLLAVISLRKKKH